MSPAAETKSPLMGLVGAGGRVCPAHPLFDRLQFRMGETRYQQGGWSSNGCSSPDAHARASMHLRPGGLVSGQWKRRPRDFLGRENRCDNVENVVDFEGLRTGSPLDCRAEVGEALSRSIVRAGMVPAQIAMLRCGRYLLRWNILRCVSGAVRQFSFDCAELALGRHQRVIVLEWVRQLLCVTCQVSLFAR
jgi:hypothetical protein